jgi:hypothetical protein
MTKVAVSRVDLLLSSDSQKRVKGFDEHRFDVPMSMREGIPSGWRPSSVVERYSSSMAMGSGIWLRPGNIIPGRPKAVARILISKQKLVTKARRGQRDSVLIQVDTTRKPNPPTHLSF